MMLPMDMMRCVPFPSRHRPDRPLLPTFRLFEIRMFTRRPISKSMPAIGMASMRSTLLSTIRTKAMPFLSLVMLPDFLAPMPSRITVDSLCALPHTAVRCLR